MGIGRETVIINLVIVEYIDIPYCNFRKQNKTNIKIKSKKQQSI